LVGDQQILLVLEPDFGFGNCDGNEGNFSWHFLSIAKAQGTKELQLFKQQQGISAYSSSSSCLSIQ